MYLLSSVSVPCMHMIAFPPVCPHHCPISVFCGHRSTAYHPDIANNCGTVSVAELDWANPEHIAPLKPPFDIVLAADCIYHEVRAACMKLCVVLV